MANSGFDLYLTGRNLARLEALANTIQSTVTTKVTLIVADLEEPNAPESIIDRIANDSERLDLLISNAGVAIAGRVETTKIENWERMLKINARAPLFLMQRALPLLRDSKHPVVIVISSVVGRVGYAGQAAYSASKHALAGLTKSFAREVHSDGIRVHLISPGGVDTEMIGGTRPDLDTSVLIEPSDIARTVGFLATESGKGMIDEINIRRSAATPWG